MPPGLLDPYVLLAGAAIGGGLFLLGLSLYGTRRRPASPGKGGGRKELVRMLSTRTAVGAIVGTLVLVITEWPVMAAGAVLLVLAWRGLSGGAAEERAAMRRLEGLAAWTESLRDTIAGAAGLEQAIPSSIRAAAPTLKPHLRALVDRLHTRMALPDALRMFADELDDPSADLVVAALILNSRLRGPGLRDVLGALAVSAREELDMRRRVEAERRSTRRSAQIVVGTALAFAAALVVFNPDYVSEYNDVLGQAVPGRGGRAVRGRVRLDAPPGPVRQAGPAARRRTRGRRGAARRATPARPGPGPGEHARRTRARRTHP
ncbi:type II secretion system F family protein [Thermocatellispora tengchongensis]|uniref:type II secretion system F family protein n=1 Tax=Thermocatellispora tengchongensis TaxID=1073253 RepID=UPI003631AC70